jgi:phosphoribosylpyrophosphate synthetase
MEAARTSETSVDNHFTRQYNPEDSSEHHTRRRENLKSHAASYVFLIFNNGNTYISLQEHLYKNSMFIVKRIGLLHHLGHTNCSVMIVRTRYQSFF